MLGTSSCPQSLLAAPGKRLLVRPIAVIQMTATLGNHTAIKAELEERWFVISLSSGTPFPIQIRLNWTKKCPDCATV